MALKRAMCSAINLAGVVTKYFSWSLIELAKQLFITLLPQILIVFIMG